jgi:hypothetical protein
MKFTDRDREVNGGDFASRRIDRRYRMTEARRAHDARVTVMVLIR